MTYQDRDSRSDASGRDPRIGRDLRPGPALGATSLQAMWSLAATAAIVFILGVVFYGINAQRTNEGRGLTLTASPAPATGAAPTAPETRGGGPATPPAETTGQGGAADQATPAGQ
jgi:hypothetical protein